MKLRGTPKNSIGVSDSKILIDATIPLWSLGDMRKWGAQTRRSRSAEAFRDTYVNGQRTADGGLQTADCGLRTGYKTRT